MNMFYSQRHYDRLSNVGTGNPSATPEQRIATWQAMLESYAHHPDVVELCLKLIAEAKAEASSNGDGR